MPRHKERAEERAKNKDPINFTCGICHKVHVFDKKEPYACPGEAEEASEEE